jgi:hypothetical protein
MQYLILRLVAVDDGCAAAWLETASEIVSPDLPPNLEYVRSVTAFCEVRFDRHRKPDKGINAKA